MNTNTIEIPLSAGTPISSAAEDLYYLSRNKGCRVQAEFNGIIIWSEPDSTMEEILFRYDLDSEHRRKAYEESPEGIIAKAKNEQDKINRINDAREYINILSSSDLSDLTTVITLLQQSTKLDYIYTDKEAKEMVEILKEHGYEENVFCGDKFVKGNKEIEARWMIGQAMSMPGYGLITKFAEEWLSKYGI